MKSGDSLAIAHVITGRERHATWCRPASRRARCECAMANVWRDRASRRGQVVAGERVDHLIAGPVSADRRADGGPVQPRKWRRGARRLRANGCTQPQPPVFIRSLAARDHLGGVTRRTGDVIDLLAVVGVDLVIVETVGTGQSEVAVAGMTDVKLGVCRPGSATTCRRSRPASRGSPNSWS